MTIISFQENDVYLEDLEEKYWTENGNPDEGIRHVIGVMLDPKMWSSQQLKPRNGSRISFSIEKWSMRTC